VARVTAGTRAAWDHPALPRRAAQPSRPDDVRLTGDNWMQKAMSLLHRGGTEHLKLSQLNFAGPDRR
jgi:hypothetical protein